MIRILRSSRTHAAFADLGGDQARTIIAQHLGIDRDRVTDDARFRDDLGADSLDAFELLMALEETFGLEIPDDAADPMQRVCDAVTYIDAQVAVGHTRRPDGLAPDSVTRNARS